MSPKGFKKASSEMSSAELDAPIDVVVPAIAETPVLSEAPTADAVVEEAPVAETPEIPVVEADEPKVPKSRFLTMHQRAVDAEKRLREIEAASAESRHETVSATEPTELPDYWITMFGDSDASVQAFQAEQARLATIEEKAAERAFERLSNREKEEQARTQEIVQSFDQAFEELSIIQDHEFTDDEQVAILDIVEQYSPKDKDGMLMRDYLLPLDKAYEIYSVRSDAKTSAKREARDSVAALTGARPEGSASAATVSDWKPGDWRKKVP